MVGRKKNISNHDPIDWILHIWDPEKYGVRMLNFIRPFLENDDDIFISTAPKKLSILQNIFKGEEFCKVNLMETENHEMDWSGYLMAMRFSKKPKVIFLNDSILYRRFFFRRDLKKINQVVRVESDILVGELDASLEKILVDGVWQNEWVSTFCFGLSCRKTVRNTIHGKLCNLSAKVSNSSDAMFRSYLEKHRPQFLNDASLLRKKINAMNLEQLLTKLANDHAIKIINPFRRDWARRLAKFIEVKVN